MPVAPIGIISKIDHVEFEFVSGTKMHDLLPASV